MSVERPKPQNPRLFRLKDALLCNPAVGPSLIQHWAKQGYLLHGTERHGSVERLTFSFSELVYLSILVRLSWFGAISKETTIGFPSRKPTEDELIEKTVAEYKDPYSKHDIQLPTYETKLTTPEPILDTLIAFDWDMLLTIRPIQVKLATASARSKQIEIRYDVELHGTGQLTEASLTRGVTLTDAVVIIDAQRIYDEVKSALGIT